MTREIQNQKEQRILILGTNNEDGVDVLYERLREILDQHNMPQIRVEVIRNGLLFPMAIRMNKEGKPIPASVVLVGTKARVYSGYNSTVGMENFIGGIENSCKEVGATMIRFRVLPGSDAPEVKGGLDQICKQLGSRN